MGKKWGKWGENGRKMGEKWVEARLKARLEARSSLKNGHQTRFSISENQARLIYPLVPKSSYISNPGLVILK